MDSKEFIKITKNLDNYGSYRVADQLQSSFLKFAAEDFTSRDPKLPAIESETSNIGRALDVTWSRFSPFETRSLTARTYPRIRELLAFKQSEIAKKYPEWADLLEEAKIQSYFLAPQSRIDAQSADSKFLSEVKSSSPRTFWSQFANWVEYCRNILGRSGAAKKFIIALTKAEEYLASKIDPDYSPRSIEIKIPEVIKPKAPSGAGTGVTVSPTAPIALSPPGMQGVSIPGSGASGVFPSTAPPSSESESGDQPLNYNSLLNNLIQIDDFPRSISTLTIRTKMVDSFETNINSSYEKRSISPEQYSHLKRQLSRLRKDIENISKRIY